MSGLSADLTDASKVYAVQDSLSQHSRIFGLDVSAVLGVINSELVITDENDILANLNAVALADPAVGAKDATRADSTDGGRECCVILVWSRGG